jgi:adenosylcobinamide-phosphate synthase
MWTSFLVAVGILVLAIVIDVIFGDPPWKMHPTFWLGQLTNALGPHFRNRNNARIEKLNGVFLALIVIGAVVIPIYFGLSLLYTVAGLLVYIIIAAIILKMAICIKLETKWALITAQAVESGNLEEGRKYVPYFSRRDPTSLTGPQIVSAMIESSAENLPDFKISSIFYYAFLGVPAALAVRAVNTLDSVIGFKDTEHINLGWFSATLDTITNYIPSRFTAILIVLASAILGEDWRGAWKIARRDQKKISSINHGWPIAAMAGALQIQLEKPGFYVVGDAVGVPSPQHIKRALRIRDVSIILCVLLLLPVFFLVQSLLLAL